jgi:hypothetical protein
MDVRRLEFLVDLIVLVLYTGFHGVAFQGGRHGGAHRYALGVLTVAEAKPAG